MGGAYAELSKPILQVRAAGGERPVIESLLFRLRQRDDVSAAEEAALRDLFTDTEDFAARSKVVRNGQILDRSILLLDGLMCRSKTLRNGQRQITALHVPGDFLDLHGFTLKRLDHDVMSLSLARVAYAPHDRLIALTQDFPHLGRLLWMTTNLDAAMHREWVLSLGQRTGAVRAAHLFCEIYTRTEVVRRNADHSVSFPITQAELGECIGLTVVHTNRVLRELREAGLVTFSRGIVDIHDFDRLREFADFDPSYLYLEKRPR